MPKRILVIGLLFVAGGLLAIWDVVSGLTHNRISFNFSVLMLPVGIGVLRGKSSSQWWARFWIMLGYLGTGALIVAIIVNPQSVRVTWFGNEIRGDAAVPFAICVLLVSLALLFLIHRLLYSDESNAYFNRLD